MENISYRNRPQALYTINNPDSVIEVFSEDAVGIIHKVKYWN